MENLPRAKESREKSQRFLCQMETSLILAGCFVQTDAGINADEGQAESRFPPFGGDLNYSKSFISPRWYLNIRVVFLLLCCYAERLSMPWSGQVEMKGNPLCPSELVSEKSIAKK